MIYSIVECYPEICVQHANGSQSSFIQWLALAVFFQWLG